MQFVIFASFKQNNRKEDNEGQRSQESGKLRKEGTRKRGERQRNMEPIPSLLPSLHPFLNIAFLFRSCFGLALFEFRRIN